MVRGSLRGDRELCHQQQLTCETMSEANNNNEEVDGNGLKNSRDVIGVQFGVYNIRPGPIIDDDSNMRG